MVCVFLHVPLFYNVRKQNLNDPHMILGQLFSHLETSDWEICFEVFH
jgi:hypothetical protein